MTFNLSPIFCAHNGVIILTQSETNITIGMVNIDNDALRSKIELRYSQYVRQCSESHGATVAVPASIAYESISQDYFIRETSRELVLNQEYKDVKNTNEGISNEKSDSTLELIEDAPIIYLLNSLLLECIDKDGSDVHIEPFNNGSRIRMRILGELSLYSIIDSDTAESLILRILFLANLDITEKRRTQDGSFHFESGTIDADVRVSVLPSYTGSSCVLRILHARNFIHSFSNLGFSPCHIEFLEDACNRTNSLVLVCGATGAGKSTTLAAMLKYLSAENKKIISIEDPIEYRIDGVVQIPVNPTFDMDFPDILRSSFRHDPDVIMIGEIRDEKTARIAVRSALTGHLVLASLHTLDAPSSIIRLFDMGIEHWLLASVFAGAICQRLIKKHDGQRQFFLPVAEVLPPCPDVLDMILKKSSLPEYRLWMDEHNIVTMKEEEEYATCI